MKKNLIALAILAACGAASAQSSVTLYGAADVWFGSVKAGGVTNTMVQSSGVDDSFFGLKGTEDLGGGLKAIFVLEQGFNIDNGQGWTTTNNASVNAPQVAAMFGRQAYVGFSSAYGEVRLGKTFTPFDEISGATTPGFDSQLAPTAQGVWKSTDANYNLNPNNTLYYATPSYSGFSGAASYSLGENKTAGLKTSQIGSVSVKYAGGPVYVGVGYQVDQERGALAAKYTRVNGSYDFGVAKLLAGYGRVAQGAARTTEWQIGASVPVSNALTLSGGYARSKDNGTNVKRTGLGLVAHYALSKRTALYGGLHANKDNATPSNKVNVYAVGVRHTF